MKLVFPVFLQFLLPHHWLSKVVGYFTNTTNPFIKNFLIQRFISYFKVNMEEALEPNPKHYATFNHFFTRFINPERRPLDRQADTLISPVDGFISEIGYIQQGQLLQAKNFNYSLKSLLGDTVEVTSLFENGAFATLYLSPRDYHRVHMPLTGCFQRMIYVPGRLFSVNSRSTRQIPHLFTRNERVITLFETEAGPMAVILVGALLVGSIHIVGMGQITPQAPRQLRNWHYASAAQTLMKGAMLGHFQLGSTVILLFGSNRILWNKNYIAGHSILLGQSLGNILV